MLATHGKFAIAALRVQFGYQTGPSDSLSTTELNLLQHLDWLIVHIQDLNFKEQAEQWLSLNEKLRRPSAECAGHMML